MTAKNTYEKVTSNSMLFKSPLTRWIVRDNQGRKVGTIHETEGGFEVHGGRYDPNDNLISSAHGTLRPTYRKAQAWFRNS